MATALNDNGGGTSQAAVGYFVDQKKGEVNELKQLLKNINVERDVKRKREIIKKVIAYMTLGIDVSRLFTDMIMAIETKDIVIKKMVYLYLCNYAHSEPEMAIMCINSLRRDCDNEDPLVRGSALRSLCSLRLESILEYVEQPLKKSLTDLSAYVRKTGVMGILKLNLLSPNLVESNGYLEQLYRMLQDTDSNVVTNVIYVINELCISTGGLEVRQSTVMALLNRIGEFSEWGLNTILDLVARYQPTSEDEAFAIMNLLDPVLRTANSGSVLATFKCFMKMTGGMPDLQVQIYARAKPPLLTLVTGAHAESQFTTLKHLELILHQPAAKGIFDDEYRQFFVRYNEPPHVKHLKVDLIPLIANENNAREIATELGEYVTDVDSELSKRAIRSIGAIAMKIGSVSQDMTNSLMELIDMDSPYVRAEAAIVVGNVIRVNPALSNLVLPFVSKCLKRVEDPSAKAVLVWILGEFGENVVEAPYLLESIIDNYAEEQSVAIKLNVLTATMKLFFKRPPEMQAMLGRLFGVAINETGNQDLHDRALLYYRLLTSDITVAKSLFAAGGQFGVVGGNFAEMNDLEKRAKLFAEFNTLAVVYGMPSVQFIGEKYQLKLDQAPNSDFDVVLTEAHSSISQHYSNTTAAPVTQQTSASVATPSSSVNLLDWDDDHSGAQQQPVASPAVQHLLVLKNGAVVPPARFQQMWTSLPESFNGRLCSLASVPSSGAELETYLRNEKLTAIASGPLPPASGQSGLKLFLCAAEEQGDTLLGGDGVTYLAQLIILNGSKEATVIIKTDAPATTSSKSALRFADTLLHSLSVYNPVRA